MRRTMTAVGVLAMAAMAGEAAAQQARAADAGEVRAAVEQYLAAHATGSADPLRDVFHPSLVMYWVRDGQLNQRTAAEYLAGFRGSPEPDEAQRRRWIEVVDVSGTAAIAKVILDYPTARFTDYFALLRIGDEWKIMSKIFHSEPKQQ